MDEIKLSRFEQEVLEALSPVEWKSMWEVSVLVGTQRNIAGRRKLALWITGLIGGREFAEELVLNANSGSLALAFEKFESLGWVEFRWRPEPAEVVARRGGLRTGERKLTEQGHRIRAKLPRDAGAADDWVLQPSR